MRALVLVVALLLLALPLGTVAAHYMPAGNPNCEPNDEFHVYLRPGGVFVKTSTMEHWEGTVRAGDGNRADCDGDGKPFDFDGDIEYGFGGTGHPTISDRWGDRAAACGWGSSHHDSTFTVADHAGATVAFVVAADNTPIDEDPSTPEIDGCTSDGVISRSASSDDCYAPVAVTPPQPNQPNHPSSGTCSGGWDGLTWVFVLYGFVECEDTLVLSLPTDGDTF